MARFSSPLCPPHLPTSLTPFLPSLSKGLIQRGSTLMVAGPRGPRVAEQVRGRGGGGGSPGPGPALRGWDDSELEWLLAEFHFLEQAVVMAEALVR